MNDSKFYQQETDWDFSQINWVSEVVTDWDMYDLLKSNTDENSVVLDLGTGGAEKLLAGFPKVRRIIATDNSVGMIRTAWANLNKSDRANENIQFIRMDNLNMTVPKEYFDVVVARHTVTDAKQIYECLKEPGLLILRGVDKYDCWQLKCLFGRGQAYDEELPVSQLDHESVLAAGFKDVELVPIYEREYYKRREDLLALLRKAPILDDQVRPDDYLLYGEEADKLAAYIKDNTGEKGILLNRNYYGITARK